MIPVSDVAKVKPLTEKQQLEKAYYFAEGIKAYNLNDWPNAQALLLKAIKIDPGCDACYYQLANLYINSGILPEATSFSESAVRLDTSNFWYKLQLARFYTMGRRYNDAIIVFSNLMNERRDLPDLYYDLASLYITSKQPDKALETLDQAADKFGYTEQSAGVRIELLQSLGRHEEALELLEELSENFPSARYYSMLGEVYSDMGKDSLGLAYFQQALELNADFTPALFGEADYYRRVNKLSIFFDKLNTVFENNAVEKNYKTEYLSMMLRMPQFAASFPQQFDTLFMYLRTPPDTLTEPIYGGYLLQTGKVDSAITVFKNNMLRYPESEDALEQYLSVIYYTNNWDTLSKYAAIAMHKYPQKVPFYTMAAIAQWQLKHVPAAIAVLEKAVPLSEEKSPQQIETYALLGDLYHEAGNAKKAYDAYEKVLAVDSLNVVVLNNYAYYLSLEDKHLDKAYAMSKKAITIEANNATYLDTFGWILFKTGKAIEAKAIFRNAMLYGGKESAVILDHYADVLHALGENDLAAVYWELSLEKEKNPEVKKKLDQLKSKK